MAHNGEDRSAREDPLRSRLNEIREEVHVVLYESFGSTVSELRQLQGMLRDAVLKLSTSFRELANLAKEEAALAERMAEGGGAGTVKRITEVSDAIHASSGKAMQGLQFEDMAAQLLQQIDERLGLLERFTVDMSLLRPTPEGTGLVNVRRSEIEEIESKLHQHKENLAAATQRSVRQESCDEGSVDLF